jgi:exodeoxyribonuclease V alpha subunit
MTDLPQQPDLTPVDATGIAEHTLRGEITRVVFTSEDSGYSVIRMVTVAGAEQTVVGVLPGAYEGQGVEVTGVWEKHREHGLQLRTRAYRFILPSSPDGIRRYLASGIIPGIGPKLAELIVDHFGGRTLEVLEHYSSRLTEIPGFGRKRLEMVRKAWQEHASRRDIFIFLQGVGVSMAYCQRIFRRYGEAAPKVVKDNPYQLAEDVDGIGFILADRIAGNLGIAKDADERLAAGVVFSLNRLEEAGHVCYPEPELLKYAAELLGVEEEAARRGLAVAIERRLAARAEFAGADEVGGTVVMVYRGAMGAAEQELAHLVLRLSRVAARGRAIEKIPPAGRTPFGPEQLAALTAAARHPLSIITGGPGVGKTTVVGELVRRAQAAGLKILLAAPTGRAAKRLSESCRRTAMTIHRMLKWEPAAKRFEHDASRPLRCDLLVVDEVSMLDLPLALYLFRAIRPGTTVVMVGDADQLPSVGPGTVLLDLIRSECAAVTHLATIYRQGQDSRIIGNAHAVNAGRVPDLTPVARDQLTDFYWIDEDDPERAMPLIAEVVASRIPKRFGFDPHQDIQVIVPMNRGSCGTKALNDLLQSRLNPEGDRPQFRSGERLFRGGDRVMQTANNYDKGVFNGDMGRIVHVDYGEKRFRVLFDTGPVEYEFVEADQLVHAYAVTVHKSQGSEFPAVVFPLLTQHYLLLQRNLVYTGMTRAKRLLVMLGSRRALHMAVSNTRLEPRFSMLLQRLRTGNAMKDGR